MDGSRPTASAYAGGLVSGVACLSMFPSMIQLVSAVHTQIMQCNTHLANTTVNFCAHSLQTRN